MYAERPSAIPGAVCWSSSGGGPQRVLPDGCMDLLWLDGALVVAGPDTRAYAAAASSAIAAVRFGPALAPAWLGVPADELTDQRVRLDALWPSADVRRLSDRVGAASDREAALEQLTGQRLGERPPDPLARQIAQLLARGWSVGRIADEVALSARQLHRRSTAAFGYGPKTLARVLRLQRALGLAWSGVSAADGAVRSGYADQAHLARDLRALTGSTWTQLAAGTQANGA